MESNDLVAKKTLIKTVGSNLILEGKKLQFSLKEPYNVLLKPEIRLDVQGWKESNPHQSFWRALFYH